MKTFIDTSALYAMLDADDRKHSRSLRAFDNLARQDAELVTTSYVLVEMHALVQRRLGLRAVRAMHEELAPLLTVAWVDSVLHEAAVSRLLEEGRRKLSLVDCTSLELIERERLDAAFAYDKHFQHAGVQILG